MKLWSVRLLTNASFLPSGDQTGFELAPQILTNGFTPLSTSVGRGAACAVATRKICPSFANATYWPFGDSTPFAPSASRHATPGTAVLAAQISRVTACGSASGLGIHPSRFGAPPRVNTTVDPSSEIDNCVDSMPLSARNAVTRTGLNAGADAVYTFRRPLSFATQAIRSVFLAATSSSGNAKLMNCAIDGRCRDAAAGGTRGARGSVPAACGCTPIIATAAISATTVRLICLFSFMNVRCITASRLGRFLNRAIRPNGLGREQLRT